MRSLLVALIALSIPAADQSGTPALALTRVTVIDVMQLQQQYLAVQAKLDKSYDDRLAGRITDELWVRKSAE